MPSTKPTTVTEYIEAAPREAQKKLREIRAILKQVAPKATETLCARVTIDLLARAKTI